jgi:6-phosphogluconolactonase (cycloisomerase 2 family)
LTSFLADCCDEVKEVGSCGTLHTLRDLFETLKQVYSRNMLPGAPTFQRVPVDVEEEGSFVVNVLHLAVMRPGAGPRHIGFHPGRPLAFLVNELDSSVATCRWNEATGTLVPLHLVPTLPPDFFGASTAAAIVVTPCGRFVYASTRGQDGIARFRLEDAAERLDPTGWTPSGGRDPRFMTLAPDGKHLLVANEQGDSLVEFTIDPDTGDLSRTGARPSLSPCTIAFL